MNRTINVTLDEAREWYNSDNETLKELALRCYPLDDLKIVPFEKIKSFEAAVNAINLDIDDVDLTISRLERISKASVAMYKVCIVLKALNLGKDLKLTQDPENSFIYRPFNPLVTENSTYYEDELNLDKMEIIGKIKYEGTLYCVLGGYAVNDVYSGLGGFEPYSGTCFADANFALLGCANEEIAKHFGKYFGMLITEAKFGYLRGFEIVGKKYKN